MNYSTESDVCCEQSHRALVVGQRTGRPGPTAVPPAVPPAVLPARQSDVHGMCTLLCRLLCSLLYCQLCSWLYATEVFPSKWHTSTSGQNCFLPVADQVQISNGSFSSVPTPFRGNKAHLLAIFEIYKISIFSTQPNAKSYAKFVKVCCKNPRAHWRGTPPRVPFGLPRMMALRVAQKSGAGAAIPMISVSSS